MNRENVAAREGEQLPRNSIVYQPTVESQRVSWPAPAFQLIQ